MSSRDHQPKQFAIDAAAKALREAGFEVEVRIDRTARPSILAEGDRANEPTSTCNVAGHGYERADSDRGFRASRPARGSRPRE
ncbi:hypothetical protein AB0E01_27350 [Nocardia vinacea]|uniref:hypothetical protein n=1 Tax=Nocardia vinacea TaxID=96468 RepID=UPI0033E5AFB1